MKTNLAKLLAAGALLLALAAPAAAASFKVIVNEANPGASLSKDELRAIYLGKSTRFANGQKAEPADLVADAPARDAFSEAVLGKPVSAVQSNWQRLIFSGKGVPPPELANDRDVVAFVRRTAGGVGYVSDAAAVDGVKTVTVRD
jgi:ABC-type phosphate transport system substrate-binding protein